MTFIVKPSRPGSIVAEAYRLKEVDERRMSRIHKAYQKKPAEPQATPAPSKKKAKPQRAAKGKR